MCLRRGGRQQRKGTGDRRWEERLLEGEGGGGDEEEAGEGMRWGEEGLEFLTVSKLEIRGSPSSQSFQMVQEKKNWSHQETLMHLLLASVGETIPGS